MEQIVFEDAVLSMDAETISNDFDDIDLYGTKQVEDDSSSNDDCDILFE